MTMTPQRILLFLAGLLIAGFGAAYYNGVFDRQAPHQAAVTQPATATAEGSSAEKTEPAETVAEAEKAPAKSEESVGADEAVVEDTTAAEEAAADEAKVEEAQVVVPSFDLLRVEPDGSLVIAGQAAPNSTVEIVNGSSVLASAKTEASGDFVSVLDRALKPGDHTVVLRSTSSEKVSATSLETAIISVPSSKEGEVVALVQQPGQPSRLISVPEAAPQVVAKADEQPKSDDNAAAPDNVAADDAAKADAAKDNVASDTSDVASQPEVVTPLPAENNAAAASDAASSDTVPSDVAASDAATTEKAEEPSAVTSEQPAVEQQAAVQPTTPDVAPSAPQQVAPAAPQEELQAAPEAAKDEPQTPPAAPQSVQRASTSPFIEAVEIDGREVFVAGQAEAGKRVRVYANEVLLGQATVDTNGRFLIETERDLPVGDYIVRADVLGKDGVTVAARAAVPFARPAGESMTSVAPAPTAAPASGGAAVQSTAAQDTEMGAALERSDGAVIIRKGDTLWHISRRVYGRGIRYTTIYQANKDQIRNPNRIYPGQTFALPGQSEDGETADLEAIKDRQAN